MKKVPERSEYGQRRRRCRVRRFSSQESSTAVDVAFGSSALQMYSAR